MKRWMLVWHTWYGTVERQRFWTFKGAIRYRERELDRYPRVYTNVRLKTVYDGFWIDVRMVLNNDTNTDHDYRCNSGCAVVRSSMAGRAVGRAARQHEISAGSSKQSAGRHAEDSNGTVYLHRNVVGMAERR